MSETTAAVRAEFTKIRGIRSTFATLALFVLLTVVISALAGWSARGALESDNPLLRDDFTPQQAGFDGILYGQLALIIFGVLVVAGEYTSGMMRVSLLAVPRRGRLYLAKMLSTAVAALVISVLAVPLGYLATQAALGPYGASISSDGVPAALAGSVVYLTLMCLFAAGLAAAARNAVVPLAILLPMVLVGTHLLSLLGVTRELARYFPDQAGTELLTVDSGDPGLGLTVMLVWTAGALGLGYLRHSRWDT